MQVLGGVVAMAGASRRSSKTVVLLLCAESGPLVFLLEKLCVNGLIQC